MSDATGLAAAQSWAKTCGEFMDRDQYVLFGLIARGRTSFQAANLIVIQSQHVRQAAHIEKLLKAELAACSYRGVAPSDIAAALQRSEAVHMTHVYRLAAEILALEQAAGCGRAGGGGAGNPEGAAAAPRGLYVPVTRKVSLTPETKCGSGGMR